MRELYHQQTAAKPLSQRTWAFARVESGITNSPMGRDT